MRLGYVQKFDKSSMPNANANLIDRLKSPPFDPKREFSMPWQSGMTGIIYRKDKVKRTPKSVDDLFDPALQGQGHDADRDARHGRPRHARGRAPTPRRPASTTYMKAIDKIQEGVGLRADPGLHRQRVPQGHPEGRLVGHLRLVR